MRNGKKKMVIPRLIANVYSRHGLGHKVPLRVTRFFYKQQANAEQHSGAELQLFENHSYSSSTLSSKNNRTYSKK